MEIFLKLPLILRQVWENLHDTTQQYAANLYKIKYHCKHLSFKNTAMHENSKRLTNVDTEETTAWTELIQDFRLKYTIKE